MVKTNKSFFDILKKAPLGCFNTLAPFLDIVDNKGDLCSITCDVYVLDKVKHTCSISEIKDIPKRTLFACRLMALSGYATQTTFSRNIEYNDPYQELYQLYYDAFLYQYYSNLQTCVATEDPHIRFWQLAFGFDIGFCILFLWGNLIGLAIIPIVMLPFIYRKLMT